ncbi:MAG: heme-dependent oxidative N-demethylase subunit alpha family protein [Burkholderiaceae bacterium]
MPFDTELIDTPFRMQPGLRRVADGETQLTPNRPDAPALNAKLAVLQAHAGQALGSAAGFDAAPALNALAAQASSEHPSAFEGDGVEWATTPLLGWSVSGGRPRGDGPAVIGACLDALPMAWRAPALLALAYAEDFAVLDAASGRIPWLAVCLPSHWAPEDKLGRHFTEIHAPVADNASLMAAAAPLMALVTGERRWQRHVWTLTAACALDTHPRRIAATPWPRETVGDALAARTWLRSERQTFIPVAGRSQAVFTIRIEVEPLTDVVRTPAIAARLHGALASMSPAVLAYRRLTDVREPLLGWLAQRAASGVA